MDGLKQYAAPWGYRAAERLSPGGRGWSLRVRLLSASCCICLHSSVPALCWLLQADRTECWHASSLNTAHVL